MAVWTYQDISRENSRLFADVTCCPFCNSQLEPAGTRRSGDWGTRWPSSSHNNSRKKRRKGLYVDDTPEEYSFTICETCGWWKVIRIRHAWGIDTRSSAIASLRELDLSDVRVPINEVRDYLSAKYEKRFLLHPRVLEETVASVFKDHGYRVTVTGRTGDDGIDVILRKAEQEIGVQVKRFKDSIEVEQIRSLAGALLLSHFTEGMFITTSSFQRGAQGTVDRYLACQQPVSIRLIDAWRFYDALKIAQRSLPRPLDEIDLEKLQDKMVGLNFLTT